ncbi:21010_t:CDS:2, partial [Gigaspora margarita]
LINEKNPATYLTEVMTVKIERDSINPNITREILMNNWDIFVQNISEEGQTMELGQTNIVCYQIDTSKAKYIKQRAYRVASDEQAFLENEILTIEQRGVIQKFVSSWSSFIILIPKKGGKKRIYIDYRKLNTITKKDIYLLPNINEILTIFEGAQ